MFQILIVDDNANTRRLFEVVLSQNGFDCFNFAGGFRFYDAVMNDRALTCRATACGMDN